MSDQKLDNEGMAMTRHSHSENMCATMSTDRSVKAITSAHSPCMSLSDPKSQPKAAETLMHPMLHHLLRHAEVPPGTSGRPGG